MQKKAGLASGVCLGAPNNQSEALSIAQIQNPMFRIQCIFILGVAVTHFPDPLQISMTPNPNPDAVALDPTIHLRAATVFGS